MKYSFTILVVAALFLVNCTTTSPYGSSSYGQEYSNDPVLTKSLFSSDQSVISQSSINTILNSTIEIPDNSKLAVINFSNTSRNSSYYGYGYWRSEAYLKLQQSYVDSLSEKIALSNKINTVSLLPSLLTPQAPTIPTLREAAVRLQAPLLVVYRIESDIYQEYRMFKSNRAKAYATVEVVLLDVRTGIIPFTTIVTRDFESSKSKDDANDQDLNRRTEQQAVFLSLKKVADDLVTFLDES